MRPKEIRALGVPRGEALKAAIDGVRAASSFGMKKGAIRAAIKRVIKDPLGSKTDEVFSSLAQALFLQKSSKEGFVPREESAPYRRWGDEIEPGAIKQMENACALPVSVRGALMPDAHLGYGLPIGGVIATKGAVIPYAVGMDIACRMKMSVLELPVVTLEKKRKALEKAIEYETSFGVGAKIKNRKQHRVMDLDWSVCSVTKANKDRAWSQLGTSGSGNHFVEFGTLTLEKEDLGLEKGCYLALLSHSGSRGCGADVAGHYSRLAMKKRAGLPKELIHLSWLDLKSEDGIEYWNAMELMGLYAKANHELIHDSIVQNLKTEVIASVENHHNFAFKEKHFGEEVIVHRKGAILASGNKLAIIPGSMGTAGYVVRGRGVAESLTSAAHGAGRRMSRKAAMKRYTWEDAERFLKKRGVRVISAGVDEVPMAYKDIELVMAAQSDLARPVARFLPKLVKMAQGGA